MTPDSSHLLCARPFFLLTQSLIQTFQDFLITFPGSMCSEVPLLVLLPPACPIKKTLPAFIRSLLFHDIRQCEGYAPFAYSLWFQQHTHRLLCLCEASFRVLISYFTAVDLSSFAQENLIISDSLRQCTTGQRLPTTFPTRLCLLSDYSSSSQQIFLSCLSILLKICPVSASHPLIAIPSTKLSFSCSRLGVSFLVVHYDLLCFVMLQSTQFCLLLFKPLAYSDFCSTPNL